MDTANATPIATTGTAKYSPASRQIRGSTLLLVGRSFSRVGNFITQVAIVNYLSKTDYGAFAYALAVVALGQSVAMLGLNQAITRFVPIYHDQRDYNKLFGTIAVAISTMISLGLAMALILYSFQGLIAETLINDHLALTLLLVLVFLAPVQALDELQVGMFAVFASPRAIFFRKHVLTPGLRLAVVALLIMGQSDVFFLAGGYLAAGILGVAICGAILFRMMRSQGLFQHLNLHTIAMPWRELYTFSIPLLTTDLVYTVMATVSTVVLEHFKGTEGVAALRAVQSTAILNQAVMASFSTLFMPMAARMFARKDWEGINNLYWQTAIWMAVFSFPIFAVTFSIAGPITVLLYGERYAQSGILLALLSLGYYVNAATGHNGLTLKVYGKLRYIVTVDVLAAVTNLVFILLLVPTYGALGAAMGTCGALIVHNTLKQIGLRLVSGINMFEWRYLKVYVIIILAALGLLLIQYLAHVPTIVSLLLAALASALVFMLNRKLLNLNQTFPELLRFPLMRRILGE